MEIITAVALLALVGGSYLYIQYGPKKYKEIAIFIFKFSKKAVWTYLALMILIYFISAKI